jgi:head-tail adaptor
MAADIDTSRGTPVFAALAEDPTVHASVRVHAAGRVVRYGKEGAADQLVSLAINRDLSRGSRVSAARRLAAIDPVRAEDVCTALLETTALHPYLRIALLDLSTRLGDQIHEEPYDPLPQEPDPHGRFPQLPNEPRLDDHKPSRRPPRWRARCPWRRRPRGSRVEGGEYAGAPSTRSLATHLSRAAHDPWPTVR